MEFPQKYYINEDRQEVGHPIGFQVIRGSARIPDFFLVNLHPQKSDMGQFGLGHWSDLPGVCGR
jgi:hypothetical protein